MNCFYYNSGKSIEPLLHTVQRGSFYLVEYVEREKKKNKRIEFLG